MPVEFHEDVFVTERGAEEFEAGRGILGSAPVSGVGESVSLSRILKRLFRRDAETHARDERAPQITAMTRLPQQNNQTAAEPGQLAPPDLQVSFFSWKMDMG